MERGSLAHRLMFVAGLVLFAGLLLALGWNGWLTEVFEKSLKSATDSLWDFYYGNEQKIDLALKVSGTLFAAFGSLAGLTTGLRYAEQNLPLRAANYTERNFKQLKQDRDALITAAANTGPETVINKVLRWFVDRGSDKFQSRFPDSYVAANTADHRLFSALKKSAN
jgi:hypothetical protein